MKLKEALELGKECDLDTVYECVNNVKLHSTSLFIYDEIDDEIGELYDELIDLASTLSVDDALRMIE